jgi:hypothetical protein
MQPTRPNVISILGWGWLAVGVMAFISGGMAFLVFSIMQAQGKGFPPSGPNMPPPLAAMAPFFQYFRELVIGQMIFAAAVVFTATSFLKLREWARKALLLFSVILLVYIIGFSIVWGYTWVSATTTASNANVPKGFVAFGIVAAIVNLGTFSVPLVMSIVSLRGKVVRKACGSSAS